jgi:O-antigen ligase
VLKRIAPAAAPVYLLACLVIGGSAQGIWGNMLLQIAGILIIAAAAAKALDGPLPAAARQVLWIAIAALVMVIAQVVPVPMAFWANGPRAAIAAGYRLFGSPLSAMPVSLAPFSTLAAMLALIPPLAMFCATIGLKAHRPRWLAGALLAGAVAGILLGALQVASTNPDQSPWYLYPETNYGFSVGFFANANHMATLLVVTLPFLAALAASGRSANLQRYSGLLAMVAGAVVVVVVGIALNGSLAGFGLSLPVAAASTLIVLPPASRVRRAIAILAAALLVGAVLALATTSIGSAKFGEEATTSVQSRQEILATTGRAIKDFMPLGSGIGTFAKVYPIYEDLDQVSMTYVVHAHNDYAELLLETGLPGMAILLAFLAWWSTAVWRVWRTAEAGPFARAASVASAAILVHSTVDFPLRTAAISAVFAMCVGLLAGSGSPQRRDASDLRPARHAVLK